MQHPFAGAKWLMSVVVVIPEPLVDTKGEESYQAVEDLVSLWHFGGSRWVPAGQADMAQEVAKAKAWV